MLDRTNQLAVISFLFVASLCFATWIDLNGTQQNSNSNVVLNYSDDDSTILTISIPGFFTYDTTINSTTYKSVYLYQETLSENISAPALRACRKYLYAVLPDGRNDELLIQWGFEPFEMPTSQKPNDQKFVETAYDPATDKVTIRLEEDLLADEYIIETGKTPSPAPPDWVPAQFETFATSDEPFFELGPFPEGITFAFRARAKNSAGYGGWTEVWVVEVV